MLPAVAHLKEHAFAWARAWYNHSGGRPPSRPAIRHATAASRRASRCISAAGLRDDESQLCLLTHHVRLLIILTTPFAVLPHVELMSALVLYIRWVEQTAVSERLVVAVNLTAPSDRQFVGVLGVGGVAGVFANHEAFHAEA